MKIDNDFSSQIISSFWGLVDRLMRDMKNVLVNNRKVDSNYIATIKCASEALVTWLHCIKTVNNGNYFKRR